MWPFKRNKTAGLTNFILQQVRDNPDSWTCGDCTCKHMSGVEVWYSNSWHFVDIWGAPELIGGRTFDGKEGKQKVGFTFWQKKKIHKALHALKKQKLLDAKNQEIGKSGAKADYFLEVMVASVLEGKPSK